LFKSDPTLHGHFRPSVAVSEIRRNKKNTRSFHNTRPPDHANCSVGSYTHGLLDLEAAAARDDTAALLRSGWVGRRI
jgi:hypothetical protein